MLAEKMCFRCVKVKPATDFNRSRKAKSGLAVYCKSCAKEYQASWNAKNPGKWKAANDNWRADKKAKASAARAARKAAARSALTKVCVSCGDDKPRADFHKNDRMFCGLRSTCKTCDAVYAANWRDGNRESYREYNRRYGAKVRATPQGRLNNNIRSRVSHEVTAASKGGSRTFELLGYSVDELKDHIGGMLAPGMTWDNYGDWHIDHIKPLASFDYTSPHDDAFRQAWSLTNLQPLWAIDNIRKNARLDWKPQRAAA